MLFNAATFASIIALAAAAPMRAEHEAADPAISGPGILLSNQGTLETKFCFFNNQANGNAWAVPKFDNPDSCTTLASGAKKFVPLDKSFKGRVQRGDKGLLHTWAEFQLAADNDGCAHGDISFEQGFDGGCEIASTDGSNRKGGVDRDLTPGAPADATTTRDDGMKVIAGTAGSWLGPGNQAAVAYLKGAIDSHKAYIVGPDGVDDIASSNNAFRVTFY